MDKKNIKLLLVEDNHADAVLIKKIFEGASIKCDITHVEDGEAAINFLDENEQSKPDIILLDINMPRKNGKEVLREIKMNDSLKYIPVIMLTSSNAADDIMDCYSLCASSYVIKPSTIEDHKKLLHAFDTFWFDFAALPKTQKAI